MKENYAPWEIKIEDFPEKGNLEDQLKFLLGFVLLAPSGHNSQPWSFKLEGNSIEFWVNTERALAKSDPERRQLSIAMGCATENLAMAADYYGFETKIEYFPNSTDSDLFVIVRCNKAWKTKNDNRHLIFQIPKRVTNRGKYKPHSIPKDFQAQLKKFENNEFQIVVIEHKETKLKLADILLAAQIESMDSTAFREELSHFIISSFSSKKTGMPGFALGLPSLISLFASAMIKKVNMSRKTRKQDEKLLKEFTPAFLSIGVFNDSMPGWLKAGRLFERIWLIATSQGINFSPLAAGVQNEKYCKQTKEIIGFSSTPRIFCRLGFPEKITGHSPRFNCDELLLNQ